MLTQDEGCDAYYARGEDEQRYHIELFTIGCFGPIGAEQEAGDFECLDAILEDCCGTNHPSECGVQSIEDAYALLAERCGNGEANSSEDPIYDLSPLDGVYCIPDCSDPPDDFFIPDDLLNNEDFDAYWWLLPDEDFTAIYLCMDRIQEEIDNEDSPWTDGYVCALLAHELVHVSQYCLYPNVLDMGQTCDLFCLEWEAFDIQGMCTEWGYSEHECCMDICRTYMGCEDDCENFCNAVDPDDCCSAGQFTCDHP